MADLDVDPGDWHKVYDDEYEDALMRAAGAMVGFTAGHGVPFQWSPVVMEAFRGAVAEAFNRGVETGRTEDAAVR